MFEKRSFEEEILRSMETSLIKNQTDNKYGLHKLAKAADFLNEAAAIFDSAGMRTEAEAITQILQHLAKDLQ